MQSATASRKFVAKFVDIITNVLLLAHVEPEECAESGRIELGMAIVLRRFVNVLEHIAELGQRHARPSDRECVLMTAIPNGDNLQK